MPTRPDPTPPTLSYRPAGADRVPPVADSADVANGFLSAFAMVPLWVGVVWAGARGDGLGLAVVVLAMAVLAVGVGRGLRRGRWGFLLGAGLFAALAGGFAGVVVWVVGR